MFLCGNIMDIRPDMAGRLNKTDIEVYNYYKKLTLLIVNIQIYYCLAENQYFT